jgi:hypothetical protein
VPTATTLSPLLAAVRARATGLDSSLHGERHRQRVAHLGAELAWLDGGDPLVAFCFGLLHDAMREHDGRDPGHGPRAAALARELAATGLLPLDEGRVELLAEACELHADGLVTADPAVGCCWDADRLELWRDGSAIDPSLLSTSAARRADRIGGARALARAPFAWEALLGLASAMPPPRSFWIEAGRLLAGVYAGPGVAELAAAGVTLFVDLTEEGELEPYVADVPAPARHVRFAVPDMTVAPAGVLGAALDAIDAEVDRGGVVYVHCWGGCGRTGTLVGCWLVRHGVDPEVALARYAGVSFTASGRPCPETSAQRAAVLGWRAGA